MTRLSIIVEWANTERHTVSRAWDVLAEVSEQWRLLQQGHLPKRTSPEERAFLATIETPIELIIASGHALSADDSERLTKLNREGFKAQLVVQEGAEYYPLKNLGAQASSGDLLLLLDSDVLPDSGWLASLLGSFQDADIQVCCGQTYVAPSGLFGKAFSCAWTYEFRDPCGGLFVPDKFYANNIVFRRQALLPEGFPAIGRRTRGGATGIRQRLRQQGIEIWENRRAAVAHPPPSDWSHLAERALAHGRDHYFGACSARSLRAWAAASTVALHRYGRSLRRLLLQRQDVNARFHEMPVLFIIATAYYGLFALAAMGCLIHPDWMASRFRI